MKILFLILVFGLAKDSYSQRPKIVETELDSVFNLGNRKEMESLMIWKLTNELDLEVEQAEKFFPRFRKHRNEIEALRKKDRLLAKSIKLDISQNKKLKQSEVVNMIKESASFRKKMTDKEEDFLIKSGDILNPEQQAKLGIFKHKMIRELKGGMNKKLSRGGKRKFSNERKNNKRGFWK